MMSNISVSSIEQVFQSALKDGMIRKEDTALLFFDLDHLEKRILTIKSLFPATTLHGIAIKANPLEGILRRIVKLGVGVEAATLGEVMIAMNTGYSPSKIVYDSPVKTVEEMETALHLGVHLNLDSLAELHRVATIKKKLNSESTIGIRINPQVGVGKILESSVAGEYSKFGVPVKTTRKEILEAFKKYEWLTGVHLHVGSQGCPVDLLINGIEVVFGLVQDINEHAGQHRIKIFDIGGGFPISYNHCNNPPDIDLYVHKIREKFPDLFTDQYTLVTEFGRWIFTNSGWTVSRVEYVKRDPGINTAMIHVGADLFIRECLNPSDWQHEYTVLDRNGVIKRGTDKNPYHLAGPLCFSGDILAKNVQLPIVEEGDYIVIHDTGGYTFSMWSHYNSRQTPRIIGYSKAGEKFEILKERGTFEDVIGFWGRS